MDIVRVFAQVCGVLWQDRRVLVAIALVLGTGASLKLVRWILLRRNLSERRRWKKHQIQKAFDDLSTSLAHGPQVRPDKKAEILALTFKELQAALKDRLLTPTQVLYAYQTEALNIHRQTNCLEEPLKEAQMWALELETKDSRHLPLYGIPVSIKDGYGIKGYDSTIGLASLVGHPVKEDCVIVKALKLQGAVPFVKTNVPQLMMAYETSNPIYGLTTNPLDKSRCVGGSSGGEGALLAAGGSILGFGNDLGGSIRIPCAICGVCGIKPTQLRMGEKGMIPFCEGQTFIRADVGPMAQEVDALVAALRALMSPVMFDLDPTLPRVIFDEEMYGSKRPLRVGYYMYDGVMHVVPACERAVRKAVDKLQTLGHELVEWDFTKYGHRIMMLFTASIMGDGGKGITDLMEGDAIDPSIKFFMWSMNRIVNHMVAGTIGFKYPYVGGVLKASRGAGSVTDWWKIGADLKVLRQEVFDDWQNLGLDVVISPGFCSPAMPHEVPGQAPMAASGNAVYNALHCPVGALPVTVVYKEDLDNLDTYPTPDPWHKMIKEAQKGSQGLPVGVQVAALPWHDELCLRVMKELEMSLML